MFVVDDHQLFLAGVRAEIGDDVDLVGDASDVDVRRRADRRARPRRRARRRPHARTAAAPRSSGRCCDASTRRCGSSRCRCPTPPSDVVGVDPRRRARVRHEDDLGSGARSTRSSASPPATRCSRRASPGSCSTRSPPCPLQDVDPELDQLTRTRTRGAPADRPRVRVQGDREGAVDLPQDRRDPRLGGAAQAPALEPPRAHRLGDRPTPRLGEGYGQAVTLPPVTANGPLPAHAAGPIAARSASEWPGKTRDRWSTTTVAPRGS